MAPSPSTRPSRSNTSYGRVEPGCTLRGAPFFCPSRYSLAPKCHSPCIWNRRKEPLRNVLLSRLPADGTRTRWNVRCRGEVARKKLQGQCHFSNHGIRVPAPGLRRRLTPRVRSGWGPGSALAYSAVFRMNARMISSGVLVTPTGIHRSSTMLWMAAAASSGSWGTPMTAGIGKSRSGSARNK